MNNKITILLFLLIYTFPFVLKAERSDNKVKAELLRKLENTAPDDTTRLGLCFKLKILAENPQLELYYINKLMKDAERLNNSKYKCLAYLGRMTLAYNNFDVDEVNRWMKLLEPIAEGEKFYDYLFSGKRCVIDMIMVGGEYEREEKEAQKMLQRAKAVDSKIGTVLAYQCLSNVYGMTYRNEEAIKMKEEAYKIASVYNIDLAMEISSTLVEVFEEKGDQINQLKWMKIMDTTLQRAIKENLAAEDGYSLWISMNLVAYLKYYTTIGNMNEAAIYLNKLDKYSNVGYETFMVNLHVARYEYFSEAKMLNEALKEIDALIQIQLKDSSLRSYVSSIFKKADILAMMGEEDKAISMYKRNLMVSDSVNIVLLNKQTEQIRADYKTDTLLLEKENIHLNIQRMILFFVLIVIVILIFFVINTKRVQKELQASEKDMRSMAEQMKQANEAKEKFLSTISTSINVPLNVVVTESLRLAADEVTDVQERGKISQILNKTSAELMKLINNILNLSKLEAGMMKFKTEDTEIVPYIQEVIAIKKYGGCLVTLTLPECIEPWLVHIDTERLNEVFNHVLVPFSSDVELTVEMKLNKNIEVHFYITGSVLAAHSQQPTQDEAIGNEVARLTILHFGGTYEIVSSAHPGIICFTLPLVKKE